ncbi:hypothetical protein OAN92_03600 [Candidatus Pelagibacter ubique]|nr:hypothetical protein [Candidatus Pelagibacter ubique]
MNKLKQTKRILTIFFMVFLFQSTSSFFEAKAADAACVVTSDGYVDWGSMVDSTGASATVCQTEPVSITMYPYGLYICTAAPTAPTTTTAADLSDCFRMYEGDGTSPVELTSTSTSRPAGTFTVPPAGVYTHAVLWAKNLMGVKNFVQVDSDITGGATGDSGDAGYCWTTSGLTTLNSDLANATCGATVDTTTYGTTLLDMECFDDVCAYTGTNDANDGEYTATSGEIPGTDWQYVDGVTSKISSTDASGVTRSTDVVVVITDTLLLCAPSTCMSGTGVETGTTADKSFMMAQTFPTVIDTGGKTPTNFYVNFQMSTGTLFDVSNTDSDGANLAAWRQGPFYMEMGLEY